MLRFLVGFYLRSRAARPARLGWFTLHAIVVSARRLDLASLHAGIAGCFVHPPLNRASVDGQQTVAPFPALPLLRVVSVTLAHV